MKTVDNFTYIVQTIQPEDNTSKHYIKAKVVETDEKKIDDIMKVELLFSEFDYY